MIDIWKGPRKILTLATLVGALYGTYELGKQVERDELSDNRRYIPEESCLRYGGSERDIEVVNRKVEQFRCSDAVFTVYETGFRFPQDIDSMRVGMGNYNTTLSSDGKMTNQYKIDPWR
ncbi:MAG: hypothetical protein WCV90_07855 [Candidatus Woesearchaeota archaeon]